MKKRILIVDDDIITLKILKKYLDEKYEVQTENAGYRFVEKIDSYDVDIILLDLEMPAVNGLEAFDAVLKNPRLKNVPVAFLTGVCNPNLVRELISKGAAGYILKTTPKSELIERVEKILNEKKMSREVSVEILLLGSDIETLKQMRETLLCANYAVRVFRSMAEARQYLNTHTPGLFIIGRDSAGTSPAAAYDAMSSLIKSRNIRTIILEDTLFSEELLERVETALK